jgi:fatty acid-binding protein DegV
MVYLALQIINNCDNNDKALEKIKNMVREMNLKQQFYFLINDPIYAKKTGKAYHFLSYFAQLLNLKIVLDCTNKLKRIGISKTAENALQLILSKIKNFQISQGTIYIIDS